jgi:hypothetical protein
VSKICRLLQKQGVLWELVPFDFRIKTQPLSWKQIRDYWLLFGDPWDTEDAFVDTEPLSPLDTVQKKHDLEEVLSHDDYRPIYAGPKFLPELV